MCDVGLQRERTALAWTRSSLAIALCSLAMVVAGLQKDSLIWIALAFLPLLGLVAGLRVVTRRIGELSEQDEPRPPFEALFALSAAIVLATLAACLAVAFAL